MGSKPYDQIVKRDFEEVDVGLDLIRQFAAWQNFGFRFRETIRVSPNVGQKNGLNKVVVGTFEMGTDSSRFVPS